MTGSESGARRRAGQSAGRWDLPSPRPDCGIPRTDNEDVAGLEGVGRGFRSVHGAQPL